MKDPILQGYAAYFAEKSSNHIARFCSKCGQAAGDFDLCCGQCSKPLLRRLNVLVPVQILLFLAAGVVLSLARSQHLSSVFLYAPLVFVGQLTILYFVRLSLRQRRFLVLLAVYAVLVVADILGFGLPEAMLSIAPLYLAIGVIVLWIAKLDSFDRWGNAQTLWLGILLMGLSLSVFTAIDGGLQGKVSDQRTIVVITSLLQEYTPWCSLAGLCLTLAIESALRVARQGLRVRQDYFPNARLPMPSASPINRPFMVVPIIIIGRMMRRACVAFYNTLVGVLNTLTRCVVFAYGVIQSFVVALLKELIESVRRLVTFAFLCVRRVAAPLFTVYLAAHVTVESPGVIEAHVFSPTWHTAGKVLWMVLYMLIVTFGSVVCFAATSPRRFADSYVRDLAVAAGYGIPTLLMNAVTLWLLSLGCRHWLSVDLGFRLRHFTIGCSAIMLGGALFLLRNHVSSATRHYQGNES